MADSKYRIAGYESELAKQYPQVADLLEAAGKDLSNTCYECVMLAMRIIGFEPKTRNDVKEFLQVAKTFNKYNIVPSTVSGVKASISNVKAVPVNENSKVETTAQIGWSDPDMEEDFV